MTNQPEATAVVSEIMRQVEFPHVCPPAQQDCAVCRWVRQKAARALAARGLPKGSQLPPQVRP